MIIDGLASVAASFETKLMLHCCLSWLNLDAFVTIQYEPFKGSLPISPDYKMRDVAHRMISGQCLVVGMRYHAVRRCDIKIIECR